MLIPEQLLPDQLSKNLKGDTTSIRLHKEGFYALVYTKEENITNAFKLIHLDLLRFLPELRQRPFSKTLNTSQV